MSGLERGWQRPTVSGDPLVGFSELDPIVHRAIDAMDRGDRGEVEALLSRHPHLVRDRFSCGSGYFSRPYLLWFVAGNPVRRERLPSNAATVAGTIIAAARRLGVDSLREQVDYTLSLVCSGRVPRESGVQLKLVDALVEAGADPRGAVDAALAHHEEGAVRRLLELGATMTLAVAASLGRTDVVADLAPASPSQERGKAFSAAAIWGQGAALRILAAHGAEVNAYNPSGFHAHGTALHNAVAARSLWAVQALLGVGADPEVRDRAWQGTALDWAEHLEADDIAAYLRGRL